MKPDRIIVYPNMNWHYDDKTPIACRYAIYYTGGLDEESINKLVVEELGPAVFKYFDGEIEEWS